MRTTLVRKASVTGMALALSLPAAVHADPIAGGGYSWGRVLGVSLELAGRDLNGTHLNGSSLAGRLVEKVAYDGAALDGVALSRLWLEGSRLYAAEAHGGRLKPRDLVGAVFQATLDDGSPLDLSLTDVRQHPAHELRDVLGYELWYETQDGSEPLCGLDADGHAVLAIPLAGRWSLASGTPEGGSFSPDPEAFTFACDGWVIAKCVLAGYKPWQRALSCRQGAGCEIITLAAHHQACTRALRADYFGDGTVHTEDGTPVDLYDALGVRYDSEAWAPEAEWDEHGARCVASPRMAGEAAGLVDLTTPACAARGFSDAGTLLVTEALAR